MKPRFSWRPLTLDLWKDLEALFGPRGGCGGCWCMAWRLDRTTFSRDKGAANQARLKAIVHQSPAPGILLYHESEVVGWCAIAPRQAYPVLARSRVLAPIDEEPVWSVSCFYVAKKWRRQGLSLVLLRAAVEFAVTQGAKIVEGYPTVTTKPQADAFVWTGLDSTFVRAGFQVVAQRSQARKVMRYHLDKNYQK